MGAARATGRRTTPTPVGKTSAMPLSTVTETDHPHACGENILVYGADQEIAGPPPRLWGKRSKKCLITSAARTTPTPVGKTPLVGCAKPATADHPHACGENAPLSTFAFQDRGPPPRLWGKPQASRGCDLTSRTTPTPVGKTCTPHLANSRGADHPHACGENDRQRQQTINKSDHPHACGENWRRPALLKTKYGPPPRLWGKRIGTPRFSRCLRTTPTPVGKTRTGQRRLR